MKKNSPVPADLNAQIGSAQRRIVDLLKTRSPAVTTSLATTLGVTRAAIRLQLAELETLGLVQQERQPGTGRGRPSSAWTLTPRAMELFPDRHSDLTVELIQSIREALGEAALNRVLVKRDQHQLAQLQAATPDKPGAQQKVKTLARVRSRMGYMAEVSRDGDALLLTEHHCPVCAAAQECQGLCRNELKLFRQYLGEDATVHRVKHLLNGDARCVYRIEPRK